MTSLVPGANSTMVPGSMVRTDGTPGVPDPPTVTVSVTKYGPSATVHVVFVVTGPPITVP